MRVKRAVAQTAEQNVFGCFFGVDEFERGDRIARGFEVFQAQGVGCGVTEFLTQHGMGRDESERRAVERVIEFVVAARRGKDHVRAPMNGAGENEVGRRIAGVEREDEMNVFAGIVARNVAREELEPRKAEGAGGAVAVVDDVGFEVNARHANGATENVRKIVINGEREVTFAATEVADAEFSRLREMRQTIADQGEEAVDLAKLRLFFIVNPTVLIADAEQTEKWFRTREQVGLLAVVAQNLYFRGLGRGQRTGEFFAAEQGYFTGF